MVKREVVIGSFRHAEYKYDICNYNVLWAVHVLSMGFGHFLTPSSL